MIRTTQTYTIFDLPRGKYIVCGEAMNKVGEVYQESCLETRIRKEKNKGRLLIIILMMPMMIKLSRAGLQTGLQALIMVSMVMMVAVIAFALVYKLCDKLVGVAKAKN